MKNISFDNPFWLIAILPLVALLLIPFFLAIRKENRSRSSVVSAVLHVIIVLLVVLAAAGTLVTTVMTETNVIVVADVSYSANRNLDVIDGYIEKLEDGLPDNSKLGLVCFGKDHKLVTEIGGELVSVKNSGVDDSATNISSALEYASTLFAEDAIKRIVLITDGKQTDNEATAQLIAAIEQLHAQNIYIDAIYVDDNIPEDAREVQVTGVTHTGATYLNHESEADVLLQSSYDAKAIVALYRSGEKLTEKAITMTKGYNVVNFELDTANSGEFDYEITITADEDESPFNNSYRFTQAVHGNIRVLLITSKQEDVETAQRLYGERATIDSYVNDPSVPFTVEELCQYDEILLSDIDVRELDNFTAFIDSVDKVVSLFGKSLVTLGDTKIQNKTDDVLKQLEDMLPVRFGNSDLDPKLYCIVIDASRSMQNASHLIMAKQAAIQLLNLLDDKDYVMVISFSGDAHIEQLPIQAIERAQVAKLIEGIPPTQGTFLGASLKAALEQMKDQPYAKKQLMLISDGMSYTAEPDVPQSVALELYQNGIITSVINTGSADGTKTLREISVAGKGDYYYLEREEDVEKLLLTEVADDLTETVIEDFSWVNIENKGDAVLKGIDSFSPVLGYVYSRPKNSATVVLTADYEKSADVVTNPPIYAYWDYGNGKVASFTTSLSGAWVEHFMDESGERFLRNMLDVNTPEERVDYPYTLSVEYDGTYSTVDIVPVTLNPYATVTMTVTMPQGEVLTEQLIFDSTKYFYRFQTPELGKYTVHIEYAYDGASYAADSYFNISYSPEYDSFVTFDASNLYEVVRNRGVVSEDGNLKLENDEKQVATYTLDFTVALLIIAVVLYVIDIIIRKLKWNDIKSLFKKKA